MSNDNGKRAGGITVGGLALLWGIITQCLQWAGVISWPWYAIWGPLVFCLGLACLLFFIVVILLAVASLD